VALSGLEGTLLIANIHIEPKESHSRKITLMRHINDTVYDTNFSHNILCGDVNITAADEGVYNFSNRCHTFNTRTLCQAWNEIFTQYTDISSGEFTHRTRSADGKLVDASRVDRIFTSLAPALLQDFEPKCGAMSDITDVNIPSDHIPFFVKFCKCSSPPSGASAIASWVPGHFLFLGALEEALDEWDYEEEGDLLERREIVHNAFHRASALVKERCRLSANTSPCDQTLAVAIAAMRAFHGRNGRQLERALKAFPYLHTYFHHTDNDPVFPFHLAHPNNFYNLISSLANKTFEQKQAENALDTDLDHAEKRRRAATLKRAAQRFSCKGKKVVLTNILDNDGVPFADNDAEVGALVTDWRPTFTEKDIDTSSADAITNIVAIAPVVEWIIDFIIFCQIICKTRNTAPGPDGLIYGVWKHGGQKVMRFLYALYLFLFNDGPVPHGFNFALFCFIPKKVSNLERVVSRKTKELRPLTIGNTERKIIASAVNLPLAQVAERTCIANQRGGLKGRQLTDAVLDIEAHAQLVCRLAATFPAILLFDFAAAFPSINWIFLFLVLVKMQIPDKVLRMIRKLYDNCMHFIVRGGKRYPAFVVSSGILTGCPLSATLFNLVIDPLLRQVLTYMPYDISVPRETLDAFLDDVSMVVCNVMTQLPIVLMIYKMFGQASGCWLNHGKCVIIPLWTMDVEEAKRNISAFIPEAAFFQVSLAGKLLGVWVGPGAEGMGWDEAMDKISRRIPMIRNFQLGLWGTIREYNIHCYSCFFAHCAVLQSAK